MRRSAGFISRAVVADADERRIVILHRGYDAFLPGVPPLIRGDAVAVGIGAGKQRGVAGSGAGVCIVVITVGEIGSVVEEQAESALAELVVISLQIVAAKLVDDDYYNQFGMGIIGRGKSGRRARRQDQQDRYRGKMTARRPRSGE